MNTNAGAAGVPVSTGLKVLLASQDAEHERLGRNCIAQLQRQLWDGDPAEVVAWSFTRLGSPTCRMLATMDAAEAHSVVVAAAGLLQLPDDVKGWLQHWPVRPQGVPGALIAVLSDTPPEDAAKWHDHSLLHKTATRCGLEYHLYANGLPPDADVPLTRSSTHRPKSNRQPAPLLAA